MKAIICERYGPPEVLQLKEVEKPSPKDDEVLIKVHATAIMPSDTVARRGELPIGRLILGLRKPRKRFRILGNELAGVIESVGKDVVRFKEGAHVYAFTGFGLGAYAEYKCMPEKSSLALKPINLSFEEAAAAVDGPSTALFFLKDLANIQSGNKILINGASGSIGTYSVQLAKYFGAEVTGVCSTANLELVQSLGADRVIDYSKEDFTKAIDTYDIIFDVVNKSSFSKCKKALKNSGIYLGTDLTIEILFQMFWTSMIRKLPGQQTAKRVLFGLSIDKAEALIFLKELIEAGNLKPVIDRHYAFDQIPEAHCYVEKGHKKGNVVITVT